MADNDFNSELPVNYEQKCACILVLDTSGSMGGEPINELNKGLRKFKAEIQEDLTASNRLEIGIVTFNNNIDVVNTPQLVNEWNVPELVAGGTTKIVDGVNKALEVLDARKEWYKETGQKYYRPYVILMTDGVPDNDQNIDELVETVSAGVSKKQYNFWSFGVENADMDMLKRISPSFTQKLKGTDFGTFFKWLSNSMSAISNSKEGDKIDIAPKTEDDNPFQLTV